MKGKGKKKVVVGYIDSTKLIWRPEFHQGIRIIRIYDKDQYIIKTKKYRVTIEEIL